MKRIVALACLAALMFVCIGLAASEQRPRLFQKKAPPVAAQPAPAGKIGDGSLRKGVLLAVVKHRVINKLVKEGDGKKKYTREEAEAAYAKLTPQMIDGAIAEASPAVAGQVVGGRLTDFLQWLSDHSDQIMKIVEMIISILALFG